MVMRRIGLLFAAALVGLALIPTVAVAENVIGQPDVDVVVPDNHVTPGQEVGLEVTLTNEGDIERGGPAEFEQRVQTARATTLELRAGDAPVTVSTGRVPAGSVPEGSVGPFTFRVAVSSDAEPGRYRLPLDLDYIYTRQVEYRTGGSPQYYDFDVERREYVTLIVEDRAHFRVVDAESNVLVGGTGNLTVTLENIGSEVARDASVTASSTSDELLLGSGSASSTSYVGGWEPGERRTVEYSASLTDDGSPRGYRTNVEVQFQDTDGIARTSNVLVAGFAAGDEQSFALEGIVSNLAVGKEGTIRGTVINEGPDRMRNPVLTLRPENPNVAVENDEYALPDVVPGDRANFTFDLDVSDSASKGYQQFPFVVRYENQEGDQQTTDGVSHRVEIAGKRDDFTVETGNATVAAGGSRTVDIAVTNDRERRITDVSAKIFTNAPLSSDDDEAFVASLAPGETRQLAFDVGVGGGALAKTYPLSLEFQFETADGDTRISDTYKVPIDVTESGGGGGSPLVIVVILVGIGAGVYWFRFR